MLSWSRATPIRVSSIALCLLACSKSSEPARDLPPRSVTEATASASTASPAPATVAVAEQRAQASPALAGGGARSVASRHGLVTCSEANATRVGTEILRQGGSAVDAAIATAFALAVTHSSAGNVGGGGFALVRPAGRPTVAIDFRE